MTESESVALPFGDTPIKHLYQHTEIVYKKCFIFASPFLIFSITGEEPKKNAMVNKPRRLEYCMSLYGNVDV